MDFLVPCVRGFPGIFHGLPGAMCEICLMSLMAKASLRMSVAILKKVFRVTLVFQRLSNQGHTNYFHPFL